MGERTYRAGDVVRHLALDQEWLLACDEEHGRIAACGWLESWNRVEEVELVLEASDQDRLERLRETAAMKGNDSRAAAAQRQLAAMCPTEGPLDAVSILRRAVDRYGIAAQTLQLAEEARVEAERAKKLSKLRAKLEAQP